ncbi:hypothetical protein RIF29_15246 [Crotalaria pallida]|uniref:Uncharacterized protein n=1 Tax=Crotalaria pallida TaxID=3830 RepID=A0AAN9FJT3_CROPI
MKEATKVSDLTLQVPQILGEHLSDLPLHQLGLLWLLFEPQDECMGFNIFISVKGLNMAMRFIIVNHRMLLLFEIYLSAPDASEYCLISQSNVVCQQLSMYCNLHCHESLWQWLGMVSVGTLLAFTTVQFYF